MMILKAVHIASGTVGEVQDIREEVGGTVAYFEDHARPTRAGWYPISHLEIG